MARGATVDLGVYGIVRRALRTHSVLNIDFWGQHGVPIFRTYGNLDAPSTRATFTTHDHYCLG